MSVRKTSSSLWIGAAFALLMLAVVATYVVWRYGRTDDAPSPQKSSEVTPGKIRAGDLAHAIANDEFVLSDEKKKYLWDTEHLAFVLNQDLLPVVRTAVRDGRTDTLAAFLSPGFVGQVLEGPGEEVRCGTVTVRYWESPDHASGKLDGAAFLERLASYRRLFATVGKVVFHFTSLSPETAGRLDGPWRGQWDLHIQGRLKDGGRAEHMLRCSARFARLSEDVAAKKGWIDALRISRSWLARSPGPLMADITSQSGIDTTKLADNWKKPGPPYFPITGAASLLDYDRDGRMDLLITDENGMFLYHQLTDGGFRDATKSAGLRFRTGGARVRSVVVADLDNDGYEDLVCLVIGFRVYRNNGDGTFRRLWSDEHNLDQFGVDAFDAAIADYDGDGRIDIYVSKQGSAAPQENNARWLGDRTSAEGLLLKNLGDWRFEDATHAARMTGESVDTFGAVWFDLESDGDPDLFLANHMGPNLLWVNQGDGTFRKRPIREGFGGFSMGVSAGDLDGDGDEDLYVANMYSSAGMRVMSNLGAADYPEEWFQYIEGFVTGNELYENRGREGMVPIGVRAEVEVSGWSYGPAVVDLDGDGRLDIYSPAGFQSVTRGNPDG